MRRYQEARREFVGNFEAKNFSNLLSNFHLPDRQRQQNPQSPDYQLSVYTIERGRQTLINYQSDLPPRSPAHVVMKSQELPPTYDDALKMQIMQPTVAPEPNTTTTTITINTQRRNSAML